MNKQKKTPRGYNIHQVRAYSLTDELEYKQNFIDPTTAEQTLMALMDDEQDGPLYSRCCIHCLDPILRGWIIRREDPNPKALLLDPEQTAVEEWCVTFYSVGDIPIARQCASERPTDKALAIEMLTFNAFNCIISAREPGTERFVVVEFQINRGFNLSVDVPDRKPAQSYIPPKSENLALVYARALEQDRLESEAIQKARELRDSECE